MGGRLETGRHDKNAVRGRNAVRVLQTRHGVATVGRMEKKTYSTAELALALDVSTETVRRAIARGQLKAFRPCPGNRSAFKISAVEARAWWESLGGGDIDL